jgi:hypothetical protein
MAVTKEEIEIIIDEAGKTNIRVRGLKGNACIQKVQDIATIIGKIIKQRTTSDFYQPGPEVNIADTSKTRVRK